MQEENECDNIIIYKVKGGNINDFCYYNDIYNLGNL